MDVTKLNEILKKHKMPGLDMKYVTEIDGQLFLLSTVDIFHGNDKIATSARYVGRYETMLFKDCVIDDNGIVDLGYGILIDTHKTVEEAVEEAVKCHNEGVEYLVHFPERVSMYFRKKEARL